MNKLASSLAVAGVFGFGLAAMTPALASPTNDQAAAESDMVAAPAASPSSPAVVLPGDTTGSAANASNGGAQSRIYEQQLHQNQQ